MIFVTEKCGLTNDFFRRELRLGRPSKNFMPLIQLNRINKGGAICINSDEILFVEVEARVTTVRMAHNLLFSVEESLEAIVAQIEDRAVERLARGIAGSKKFEPAAETPAEPIPAA
ncbi:MAG: hypothetical protein RLZZ350_36 [Verrucomicrobiota bacterium]|jgi:hypothetical protein